MVRETDEAEARGGLTSPFCRFMNQEPPRQIILDVLYQAVGGYCSEKGWWWRYDLSEEERNRRVSRPRMGYDSLSIVELFGMVQIA